MTRPPTDLPDIIGLSGYAGSGKDVLARLLANKHGYRVAHLADGVREALRRLDPILHVGVGGHTSRWSAVMDRYGYAVAKAHRVFGPEVRRLQQMVGTEVGREMFGEDVWVNALDRSIGTGSRVVVADVRFANESAWLERAGGLRVRIHRPGVGPLNEHASECLDGFDARNGWIEILNDGTPEQMLDLFERAAAKMAAVTS